MKSLRISILIIISIGLSSLCFVSPAQKRVNEKIAFSRKAHKKGIVKYGTASYYADKFEGRKTATGEKYNSKKFTAACNIFPLNSWIKVTNLHNHKSIILKVNDRLNKRNHFLVDVSKSAAKKLDFLPHGLTKVKVEQLIRHH